MHLVHHINSIKTRLMLSMIALTALTVFGFTLISYYQHQQSQASHFQNKAEIILSPLFDSIQQELPATPDNIQLYLTISLLAKESTQLPRIINSYKDLDTIIFYHQDNTIVQVGKPYDKMTSDGFVIDIPFVVDDTPIAYAKLIFNQQLFQDAQQQILYNGLSFFWLFLLIGIIGARFLGNSIIDPIRHLAMHLKSGDLYHPPYMDRADEIGAISRTVNQLAVDLDEKETKLTQLAYYDSLTGLANRPLLLEQLHQSLLVSQRANQNIAVLFIDLNGFKHINDTYGHNAGDELLRQVAKRMQESSRKSDIIARFSGDEFIIILSDTRSQIDIADFCDKLTQTLDIPFELSPHTVHISASIGIALYPQHHHDAETLINMADKAMYHAKSFSGNQFRFYHDDLHQQSQRLSLEAALRAAIINDDITLHFQPQFSLHNQQLSGIEALARWTHQELGPIGPDQFIPLAEETGLIQQLGNLVLNKACTQMRQWLDAGLPDIKMAVNLSPKQFNDPDLLSYLQTALEKSQLPAHNLEVEITESMAMHKSVHAVELINDINTLGISLALDDFGTGYSSLTRLKLFQLRVLKIDKSFVQDLVENEHNRSIVKAILSLTRELKLQVVAEGIETQQQMALLLEHGAQQGQGYWFSKPLTAQQFSDRFLASSDTESDKASQYY